MEYRPLGRTGVQVSKLCLGTMMFGAWGKLPAADVTLSQEQLDRIDKVVRPGVNLNPADTNYGEQVLEPILRRR